MLMLALISIAILPVQDAGAYRARVYTAPIVRPFEPPSNFGRVTGEGDGEGGMLRRPLVAPVVVEAYRGSYEYAPSGPEAAYDAGVDNAQRVMDARMGPLDGRWKLRDTDGHTLMTLSLMDEGEGQPLEGAYRTGDAAAQVGPLGVIARHTDALVVDIGGQRLSLIGTAEGWSGTLVQDGRQRQVILVR